MYNYCLAVSILSKVWSVLVAILILLIMILVHEFGHYVAGKIFNFKINEFAVGFGPAILKKKKKNGEVISLRLLPLGGFCAFEGEDEENPEPNAFNNKKPWQRIIVLISGAFMNYLLALLVIIISFCTYGQSAVLSPEIMPVAEYENYSLDDGDVIYSINGKNVFTVTDLVGALNGKKAGEKVKIQTLNYKSGKCVKDEKTVQLRADVKCKNITEVAPVCKALGISTWTSVETSNTTDKSKLLNGDFITRIGRSDSVDDYYETNVRVYSMEDILRELRTFNSGENVVFWVAREDSDFFVPVTFTLDDNYETVKNSDDEELLKVFDIKTSVEYYRIYSDTVKTGFFKSIGRGFVYSIKIGGTIFTTLGQLLTGALGINKVGGTITTIKMTSEIVSYGFKYILEIMAYIGVNLAVFNLLPIPALDGSKVVFTVIEWIRGKPVNRKVEAIIHAVGLVLLFGFAIFVDLLQLFY